MLVLLELVDARRPSSRAGVAVVVQSAETRLIEELYHGYPCFVVSVTWDEDEVVDGMNKAGGSNVTMSHSLDLSAADRDNTT